jgi:hypothetical protein
MTSRGLSEFLHAVFDDIRYFVHRGRIGCFEIMQLITALYLSY